MTKGIKILDVHAMIRIMKDIDPSYFENKGE